MKTHEDLPAMHQHRNLLFDFYGLLLTPKQISCFTMRYLEDYSLTEISAEFNVSPQAVVDLLKRTEKRLEHYEKKLGLIKKYKDQQNTIHKINAKLDEFPRSEASIWLKSEINKILAF